MATNGKGNGSPQSLKRLLATDGAVPGAPALAMQRFLRPRPRPAPGEVCEFCNEPIPDQHDHVADLQNRSVVCACRGCYLLFTTEGAAGGRYRAIPDRSTYDSSFVVTAAQWEALQVPVAMCFFFHNSSLGKTVAFYPGPAGATESLLPLDVWAEMEAANPILRSMLPDVEALLVRFAGGTSESYVVPIDRCYELVGVIRRFWKGFDGGSEARDAIDTFFRDLRGSSRPVPAHLA